MNNPQQTDDARQQIQYERLTLLRDCHDLVEQIARRPGSAKLLTGAKAALELYAGYKANRQQVRR